MDRGLGLANPAPCTLTLTLTLYPGTEWRSNKGRAGRRAHRAGRRCGGTGCTRPSGTSSGGARARATASARPRRAPPPWPPRTSLHWPRRQVEVKRGSEAVESRCSSWRMKRRRRGVLYVLILANSLCPVIYTPKTCPGTFWRARSELRHLVHTETNIFDVRPHETHVESRGPSTLARGDARAADAALCAARGIARW